MAKIWWVVAGGTAFWLPAMVLAAVLHQNVTWFALNSISLSGMALLGVASYSCLKKSPRWIWMLVGVYVLGPISMLAPSVFFHTSNAAIVPGENVWLVLFCLFPPITLWMATLNGMIFAVLIVTVALPLLAKYRRV